MIEGWSPMKTDGGGMGTKPTWLATGYGITILGTFALFFVIRAFGESLTVPTAGGLATALGPTAPATKLDVLMHVLLSLLTIIVTCRVMGSIFGYLQQPPVIGEVLAGIMLGPSLLGRVSPGLAAYLLPPEIAPFLGLVSQLGVILYMFMVGLELDTTVLCAEATLPSPSRTPASSPRSCSAPRWRWGCTPGTRPARCRSPSSPCSWASRCR